MYDTYFVSTVNHLFKKNRLALYEFIDKIFREGTDFQKAYCSGLEDYLINHGTMLGLVHTHIKLDELVKSDMANDGYSDGQPIEEFLKYNVWVTSIGDTP